MSSITALPSAARTATVQSAAIKTAGRSGCHVILDVTAVAATPSITLSIEALDPVSGQWYNLLTGSAVTAIGTTVYRIHPSLTAAANATAKDSLPSNIRVNVAHADADSITYSVGVSLT